MHVFAKLFEDRLEWRLETEAFSRRESSGEDDVLDFFVGHFVNVDLTRQPASQSAVGVFDPALLRVLLSAMREIVSSSRGRFREREEYPYTVFQN